MYPLPQQTGGTAGIFIALLMKTICMETICMGMFGHGVGPS